MKSKSLRFRSIALAQEITRRRCPDDRCAAIVTDRGEDLNHVAQRGDGVDVVAVSCISVEALGEGVESLTMRAGPGVLAGQRHLRDRLDERVPHRTGQVDRRRVGVCCTRFAERAQRFAPCVGGPCAIRWRRLDRLHLCQAFDRFAGTVGEGECERSVNSGDHLPMRITELRAEQTELVGRCCDTIEVAGVEADVAEDLGRRRSHAQIVGATHSGNLSARYPEVAAVRCRTGHDQPRAQQVVSGRSWMSRQQQSRPLHGLVPERRVGGKMQRAADVRSELGFVPLRPVVRSADLVGDGSEALAALDLVRCPDHVVDRADDPGEVHGVATADVGRCVHVIVEPAAGNRPHRGEHAIPRRWTIGGGDQKRTISQRPERERDVTGAFRPHHLGDVGGGHRAGENRQLSERAAFVDVEHRR